jgi:hypothetical protein
MITHLLATLGVLAVCLALLWCLGIYWLSK